MIASYDNLNQLIDYCNLSKEMINHYAFKGNYQAWLNWQKRYLDYRFQLIQYKNMFSKYAFNDNEHISSYARSIIALIDSTIEWKG